MAHVSSNLDSDVGPFLLGLAGAFNLREGRLARRIFDVWAGNIESRFHQQAGADAPFFANRGKYGERKERLGVPVGIGIGKDAGDMARSHNFFGPIEPDAHEATMGFGWNDWDIAKGCFFQNGGAPSDDGTPSSGTKDQPARPFFEISEEDEELAIDILGERFTEHVGGI